MKFYEIVHGVQYCTLLVSTDRQRKQIPKLLIKVLKGLIGPSHHEIYKACTIKGGRVGGGGYLFEFLLCVLRQIVSRMFIVVYTPPDLAGTSVCVQ